MRKAMEILKNVLLRDALKGMIRRCREGERFFAVKIICAETMRVMSLSRAYGSHGVCDDGENQAQCSQENNTVNQKKLFM